MQKYNCYMDYFIFHVCYSSVTHEQLQCFLGPVELSVLSINIWRCLLIHFNSSCQLKTSKKILWICSPRYGGCKLRVFLSQRMEPCFF